MNVIPPGSTGSQVGRTGTPQPGNQFWSGYAVTAGSSTTINQINGSFTIPSIDCSLSYIGSNGFAVTDFWVGIDGFGENTVEQDGIEAWCTGPANRMGTAGPFYSAWYDICCTGRGLTFFPNQPALHAGDSVQFATVWNTATRQYNFDYIDFSDHNKRLTAAESCPSGSTCSNKTAEVITEAPGGGPPTWLVAYWSNNETYTAARIFSGSHQGSLKTNGTLWTSSGPLLMKFPNQPPPYVIANSPSALSSDGQSFSNGAVVVFPQ
jgi:hypothetical protein